MKKILMRLLPVVLIFLPLTVSAQESTDQEYDISRRVRWIAETVPDITKIEEWETLSDEELTDVINHSTEQQVAMFLYGLTEEEFYEVIERETPLKYPVYQFQEITQGEEIIQQKEVLAEHYYEYALNSMVSAMAWSDETGNYEGTASGYFYFKIKLDGEVVTNLTVKVNNITAGGKLNGKYTISGTYGSWETTSVTSEMEERVWSGVVLKGSYQKPAHYYTLWSSSGGGLGRYDPWSADYENYTLSYKHFAEDKADDVRIQVNGCNIGLVEGYTEYHATGVISLVKYKNELRINPNGGVHDGQVSTYTLSTKKCEKTTTVVNPTKTGYQFEGWTLTNAEGAAGSLSGRVFTHCNKGAVFSTDTDDYSKTTVKTTLKAKWTPKEYPYEVRHYKQQPDGKYLDTPDDVDQGKAKYESSFSGSVKSYTGYRSPAVQTMTIGLENNIISYYYEKIGSDLRVNPNGGTWRGSEEVTVIQMERGASITIEDPDTPVIKTVRLHHHDENSQIDIERLQKYFSHWTKSGGGYFDADNKQFTFSLQDAELTANYEDAELTLPVLKREHYIFVGWDSDRNLNPIHETPEYLPGETIPVGENRELHAIWKVDFKLEASIERVLKPSNPIFETGEMGVLKISLKGFAERVTVSFPYEMSRYDGTLSTVHTLDPKLMDSITQEFQIPLDSSQGNYRVMVNAYNKDGDALTVYPSLTIQGTILDDFRTRLR